ncbi:MAG: molybdenum cofactor biosynthesis protein MoaE [Bradymonadia bacterium]
MAITVLYFAIARERAGLDEEAYTLAEGATLAELIESIYARHPALAPLHPHVRWAVDEAFVLDHQQRLSAEATVAMIPPVSGGRPEVLLTDEPLDPQGVEHLVNAPDRGGLVTFTGRVRDHTGEHQVVRLEYEAYRPMAVKVMQGICEEALGQWPGARIALHHRLGVLPVGEAAVVVSVSTPHRREAFAACQFIIDRLKEDVPIFKKEIRADGSVWVGLGP